MVQLKTYQEDVYDSILHVHYGVPLADACDESGVEYDEDERLEANTALCVTWHDRGHMRGMIWFNDKKPDPNTIAHECLHMCRYVLQTSGIPLIEETEEAYAYYLGYLVGCVHEGMKR